MEQLRPQAPPHYHVERPASATCLSRREEGHLRPADAPHRNSLTPRGTSPWRGRREGPSGDGAADLGELLLGVPLPPLRLESTAGGEVQLSSPADQRTIILYTYPGVETNDPGRRDPDGLLSGACTMQARGFRDLSLEFAALSARVYGLRTQSGADQAGFSEREGLPFELLSDPRFQLAKELGLPTKTVHGVRVYDRLALTMSDGLIDRVFYPAGPARALAGTVLRWCAASVE